jgi:hypothetical protein
LYVVSGGYLFSEQDALLQDRLYINDGKGNFSRSTASIPVETLAGSCVVPFDVDQDHDMDLFVGTRLIPGNYPMPSPSLLLINDGTGKFTNEISTRAPALENAGMVTDAVAQDINMDGKQDLVVVGEWMPVSVYINRGDGLVEETEKWFAASTHGWWNVLEAGDFDQDGKVDFIVGNYGLNNLFNVSPARPATLIYKDFNQDGQVDPFFSYYIGDQSFPFASRDEALGQVNTLRPRFPDYTSYANATLENIFTKDELAGAHHLQADFLKTVWLRNTGAAFEIRDLPIQAQYAPVYAVAAADIDRDGDLDIVLGGNESMVRVRIGKSDGNEGVLLINDGAGKFTYLPQEQSGLKLKADVRSLLFMANNGVTTLIVGQNGHPVRTYQIGDTGNAATLP